MGRSGAGEFVIKGEDNPDCLMRTRSRQSHDDLKGNVSHSSSACTVTFGTETNRPRSGLTSTLLITCGIVLYLDGPKPG